MDSWAVVDKRSAIVSRSAINLDLKLNYNFLHLLALCFHTIFFSYAANFHYYANFSEKSVFFFLYLYNKWIPSMEIKCVGGEGENGVRLIMLPFESGIVRMIEPRRVQHFFCRCCCCCPIMDMDMDSNNVNKNTFISMLKDRKSVQRIFKLWMCAN